MKKILFLLCAFAAILSNPVRSRADGTLPVTGTFINLPYQDVRNKYTNPQDIDCTEPMLWYTKVAEMKEMGMEYLVFMSVANEGECILSFGTYGPALS